MKRVVSVFIVSAFLLSNGTAVLAQNNPKGDENLKPKSGLEQRDEKNINVEKEISEIEVIQKEDKQEYSDSLKQARFKVDKEKTIVSKNKKAIERLDKEVKQKERKVQSLIKEKKQNKEYLSEEKIKDVKETLSAIKKEKKQLNKNVSKLDKKSHDKRTQKTFGNLPKSQEILQEVSNTQEDSLSRLVNISAELDKLIQMLK